MTNSASYLDYVHSNFGILEICAEHDGITAIHFVKEQNRKIAQSIDTERAAKQLTEYFAGTRQKFDLALNPKGTPFQQQVWQQLLKIGYGETCSYADIANKIENPKAVRAVGAANGRNPITIIVPCHRVIGSNGSLTGYAWGTSIKAGLLALEQTSNHI